METDYTKQEDNIEYDSERPERAKPLAKGDKIGALVLVSRTYRAKKDYWQCTCDCGASKEIRGDSLRSGRTKSCGDPKHRTLGRRNQVSGFMPKGDHRFTIYGYDGNPTRPAENQLLYSIGFAAVSRANAKPGEYHLSRCTPRQVLKGGVSAVWIAGMVVLRDHGYIGPREEGMSVPQWAEKYGVAYKPTLRAGRDQMYREYEQMEFDQKFFFKGQWLDYGDGK